MTEKILVPVLGESITEATISKWLKSKGDNINADEPIVELETDKVNLEVPSPINGTLTEVNFKDGDTVEVGAILGKISSGPGDQKEEDVKNESKFIDDLGADSLDTVELVMALEEEFETEIPDEEAEKITTVQEAIDYINNNLS